MLVTTAKPIRIAIVLGGEEFLCQPITLPFSLEGHPSVDIVLYGATPGLTAALPVEPLTEFRPEGFDAPGLVDRDSSGQRLNDRVDERDVPRSRTASATALIRTRSDRRTSTPWSGSS